MCENSEGNERSGKVTSCSAPVGNTTCSFSDESGIKKKCLFINFIIYFISILISKFIDILLKEQRLLFFYLPTYDPDCFDDYLIACQNHFFHK